MNAVVKKKIYIGLATIVCFSGLFFLCYEFIFFHANFFAVVIFSVLWLAGTLSFGKLMLNFFDNFLSKGKNKRIASTVLLSYYLWITAYGFSMMWINNLLIDTVLISLLFVVLFWGGIFASFFVMRSLCKFFLSLEEDATMKQIELDFIKHQLNPHFLFNHLNNVAATIMYDSKMALDYTYKLSEFLRFQLDISKKNTISIHEEIFFIQCYIDIEKLRLGDKNLLSLRTQIENPNCQIPPLLFYPLIELAIKKNYAYSIPSHIDIMLIADLEQILLTIRHAVSEQMTNGDENRRKAKEIEDRLAVLFQKKFSLTIVNKEGIETTELKIYLTIT